MAGTRQRRRSFGRMRRTSAGRFQVGYVGPDGRLWNAPETFANEADANRWLEIKEAEIRDGRWVSPAEERVDKEAYFRDWVAGWLETKVKSGEFRPRTAEEYSKYLDRFILPKFGDKKVKAITASMVREWYYEDLNPDTPSMRSHVDEAFRHMMNGAVAEDMRDDNACKIIQRKTRAHKPVVLSIVELIELAEAINPRYKLMILIAGSSTLRFGEVTALRRSDIVFTEDGRCLIRVDKGVSRTKEGFHVGDPKTEAGRRTPRLPAMFVGDVRRHLLEYAAPGKDGLLFPAKGDPDNHLATSTFAKVFTVAKKRTGHDRLTFHDLRHTAAVMAAQTGASLADLMERMGHSSPKAAMIYQHAAQGSDDRIAERMNEMWEAQLAKQPKRTYR